MMRNVYLHGHLGKKFGKSYSFDVVTAGEVFRALYTNFGTDFLEALKEGSYRIVAGLKHKGFDIELEYLNDLRLGDQELHVIPVAKGGRSSKGGGAVKAVLGVAIIGAAIFFSGGTLAAPLAGLASTFSVGGMAVSYGALAGIGVALTLAGASSMLAPKDKPKAYDAQTASYSFAGPINVNAQGNAIPIIVGDVIVGSQPISVGFTTEDLATWAPS